MQQQALKKQRSTGTSWEHGRRLVFSSSFLQGIIYNISSPRADSCPVHHLQEGKRGRKQRLHLQICLRGPIHHAGRKHYGLFNIYILPLYGQVIIVKQNTESRIHRLGRADRYLSRSCSPACCSKPGQLSGETRLLYLLGSWKPPKTEAVQPC